jgi:hypothetical protein
MKGIASSSKQQNENNPALQQHGRRRLSCDGNLKPSIDWIYTHNLMVGTNIDPLTSCIRDLSKS